MILNFTDSGYNEITVCEIPQSKNAKSKIVLT